jgi:hypothetical protein
LNLNSRTVSSASFLPSWRIVILNGTFKPSTSRQSA